MSNLKSLASGVHVPTHVPIDYVVQPPIEGDIYATSFEASEGYPEGSIAIIDRENGFNWRTPSQGVVVSSAKAKTGSQSVVFPFEFFTKELAFDVGSDQKELWFSWDQFIPANYSHDNVEGSDNNKFLAMWGGGVAGKSGLYRDGPYLIVELWPINTSTLHQSKALLWIGSRVNNVVIWTTYFDLGEPGGDGQGTLISNTDLGKWMQITVHMKYATRDDWLARTGGDVNADYPEGDGIYELWKKDYTGDIRKIIDVNRGPFYANNSITHEEAQGFDSGYLLGANNAEFAEQTDVYVDNWVISTTPLNGFTGY